jgi:hydrogenase maturation protein HypF
MPETMPAILAVGGHLKNTVALSVGRRVFVSQHIGNMETAEALRAFERVIDDFLELYGVTPVALAHDMHPDYASTRWAEEAGARGRLRGVPRVPVQHHHAHLASCLAENGDDAPALGVIWDGTGYGTDGTVWGGEFLLGNARGFRRVGRLRPFHLPGGEAAVREPRRSGLSLLWEMAGEAAFERDDLEAVRAFEARELRILASMLARGIQCPVTTSAGRLFDGAAALLGLRQRSSFEAQAAMELEFAADPTESGAYPAPVRERDDVLELDWFPLLEALLEERRRGLSTATIAARFHGGLAAGIRDVARRLEAKRIALSGGCFQNRWLLGRTVELLEKDGSTVLLQRQVPPNDGGLSLGQVRIAAARFV